MRLPTPSTRIHVIDRSHGSSSIRPHRSAGGAPSGAPHPGQTGLRAGRRARRCPHRRQQDSSQDTYQIVPEPLSDDDEHHRALRTRTPVHHEMGTGCLVQSHPARPIPVPALPGRWPLDVRHPGGRRGPACRGDRRCAARRRRGHALSRGRTPCLPDMACGTFRAGNAACGAWSADQPVTINTPHVVTASSCT
jgi:hypothetical protein